MRHAVVLLLLCAAMVSASFAQTFTTLVNFNGSNGNTPYLMALIQGTDGNFYGTTQYGGTTGHGVVFKMTPSGTVTVLYSFSAGNDGEYPAAGLVQGTDGNFYGTTRTGGASGGVGTVFKITPSGVFATLHSFKSATEGGGLYDPLVQGDDGNFYGTTYLGGAHGGGTVFKITPGGTVTVLYSFCSQNQGANCTDGTSSQAGLALGTDGNFYGVTTGGGTFGHGTVFKITPGGTFTSLHSFDGADDGVGPAGKLVQATDGNFYGTTYLDGPGGNGTVFRITPGGALTTIFSFCKNLDCSVGAQPLSGMIQAADGKLYGTTSAGGHGHGTVFSMTLDGTATGLHSFCPNGNCSDGSSPLGGVVQASDGTFYGVTEGGGSGRDGTVFSLSLPQPSYTLTVSTNGSGSVTSADGYINCPSTCSHKYLGNTHVKLTATAAQGWAFSSWAGCDQMNGNVCTVTMNKNRSVTATFTMAYQLSVAKVGNGTVTSGDGFIDCGDVCSHYYSNGTQVTLTAAPDQGWAFTSWTGCDQVNGNVCTVTMKSSRTVTAQFSPILVALTVAKSGNGTVSSTDTHLYCGNVCSYLYAQYTQVTLSAVPVPGYTFNGWTGCDNVNGSYCSLTMSSARNVGASFDSVGNIGLTSLTFKPSYVRGGQASAGTLTLNGPAPQGGLSVALSSDHPGVAHPPSFVFIPGGRSSISFAVQTLPVKSNTTVTIMATAGASHVSGTLTVGTTSLPPSIK